MTSTATRFPRSARDDAARSDARLGLGTTAGVVLAFAVVVVPPYAGYAPPAGLDGVWSLVGLLTLVLGPLAAGLAGAADLVALWRREHLDATTRRMHVVSLLLAAGLFGFLASALGSAVVGWWLD